MKQCWRCRKSGDERFEFNIHHIDGDQQNDIPINKLRLCKRCHDYVQGICDNCLEQKLCYLDRFRRCWQFEDSIPPIYFKPKIDWDSSMIPAMKENEMEIHRFCVVCKTDFIVDNRYVSNDLWCPKCMNELVKNNDPRRWKLLQEWKASLGDVQAGGH